MQMSLRLKKNKRKKRESKVPVGFLTRNDLVRRNDRRKDRRRNERNMLAAAEEALLLTGVPIGDGVTGVDGWATEWRV